jgi:uncharacterized protein YdeI (YjbR/CyaY-like superfamily)
MPNKPASKLKELTPHDPCDLADNKAAIQVAKVKEIDPSFLHTMPEDIQELLDSNSDVKVKWDTLTPLTKNEWICWVTIVKQQKTREEHLVRLSEDLLKGKRRPCCWPGCPHRRKSAGKWFK